MIKIDEFVAKKILAQTGWNPTDKYNGEKLSTVDGTLWYYHPETAAQHLISLTEKSEDESFLTFWYSVFEEDGKHYELHSQRQIKLRLIPDSEWLYRNLRRFIGKLTDEDRAADRIELAMIRFNILQGHINSAMDNIRETLTKYPDDYVEGSLLSIWTGR